MWYTAYSVIICAISLSAHSSASEFTMSRDSVFDQFHPGRAHYLWLPSFGRLMPYGRQFIPYEGILGCPCNFESGMGFHIIFCKRHIWLISQFSHMHQTVCFWTHTVHGRTTKLTRQFCLCYSCSGPEPSRTFYPFLYNGRRTGGGIGWGRIVVVILSSLSPVSRWPDLL